jgi:predicted short-subunit dehydrogenase-like oxidoreductase (DUF2520 family)
MDSVPRGNRTGIIGAGRVGAVLGAALGEAGYPIVGVSGRSPASASRLLAGVDRLDPAEVVARADLVIISVPDDALRDVVDGLAGAFRAGQVVAHTSGAHGTGVLRGAVDRGARPLALHPAMTFAGRPADLERLRKGISFGVTAPPDVKPLARTLVEELGGTVEWIGEERRELYHAALVHGANHLVTLVNDALDRLRDAGVAHPERLIDPLLSAALDNTLRVGDAALTGPVSRGDAGTVARHLTALAGAAPETVPTYRALARRTADRAHAAGRLSGDRAEAVHAALERSTVEHHEDEGGRSR